MEVHHQQRPPLTTLVFDNAALMDVAAGRGILVNTRNAKLCAILSYAVLHPLRHLCQWGSMIAEGFVGGDGDGLVGSPDALATRAEGTPIGLIVGRYEIIHPINLIHMMSLAHSIALGDDDTLGLFDGAAHVGLEFRTLYLAIAVDSINLAVIVKKHREVVDAPLHIMVLPRAADILGSIALESLAIDVRKHIELSVGITDGRCPDPLAVNLPMVLQREGIVIKIKTVKAVADVFPVDQVSGVQNDQSRHAVHGGAGQIVVIAHPEDVRV